MTFYGKPQEPPKPATRELKRYYYTDDKGNTAHVRAHAVYFYESGHVGFWNGRTEDNDGTLVLAIRAFEVWEDE